MFCAWQVVSTQWRLAVFNPVVKIWGQKNLTVTLELEDRTWGTPQIKLPLVYTPQMTQPGWVLKINYFVRDFCTKIRKMCFPWRTGECLISLIDGEIPWENDKVTHSGRWPTHLASDWDWLCHLWYKDHSFAELKIKTEASKPKVNGTDCLKWLSLICTTHP